MVLSNAMENESQTHGLGEDNLTRAVEGKTAKIPSMGFLGLAVGAMAVSAGIELFAPRRKKEMANFVGLWVPTILLFGIYNKLVKLEEWKAFDRPAPAAYH